jgi:nucleotide-binding universal stress UspA family protein
MTVAPLREILCATALDPSDERAFVHALRIAAGAEGQLRQVHFGERPRPGGPDWSEFPRVRKTLSRWQMPMGRLVVRKVLAETPGDAAEGLLCASKLEPTDLIVLSTHGRTGLARLAFGSVAESVLEGTQSTPVLLLPPGTGFVDPETGQLRLRRVFAPIASPPGYRRLLEDCQRLMASLGLSSVEGRLLHLDGTGRKLDPAPLPPGGVEWDLRVRSAEGSLDATILKEIEDIAPDLVVMTTEGPQGLSGLLRGSVTERILRHAHCPILALARH